MLDNKRRDALPTAALSVTSSGDVYLADPTQLPQRGGDYSIQVRATNAIGISTDGIVAVTTFDHGGDEAASTIKVQQLLGRKLVFDFRPTSLDAAGNRLMTTMLVGGKPLAIGQTYTAMSDGIVYGTYIANNDGTLIFSMDQLAISNPKLYQSDPGNPGQQTVSLPSIVVLLVSEADDTKELKVIARRAYGD